MEEVSFQLTQHDIVAAQKLHMNAHWRRPVPLAATLLLIAVMLAISSDAGIAALWHIETAAVLWPIALVLLGLVLVVVPVVVARLVGARQFRAVPALAAPFTLTPTDNGPLVRHADGQQLHRWENILNIRSDRHNLLLYLAPWMFFVLPQKNFPAGMAEQITAQWQQRQRAR